ncbi:MAG: TonB-dependent receptor plug domain-containing protein [Verrucomicrobia bacterium]|nr:TonB-dependent receptor plug domain-containing protein [Verrucomicrobiota bacterium]
MIPTTNPSSSLDRAKKLVSLCLAASIAGTSFAQAPSGDAVRRLQDENAALRKRLAELEGKAAPAAPAAAAAATKASAAPAASRLATDEGVVALSPFQVKTDKDFGYLKTNSITATRIGTEIQRTPLAISILSAELIADTNTQSITDVLRFTSSGSGDNNFVMQRPANGATPVGAFTLRGFQVNSMLRNGTQRYTSFNLDNTERVEIVKGPAALFFGQGAPGGVINYVLKDPQFAQIPTTITHISGSDQKNKVVLDTNQQLSKNTALRVIGSWENSAGERRWDYIKNNNVTGAIKIVPFDSGKLSVTLRAEYVDQKFAFSRNQDWIYPDGWFQAYATPTPALIAAAGLSANADPVAAYRARIFNPGAAGTWGNDMRIATGNFTTPTYTKIIKGAYYQDANNKRIRDKAFSYNARGANTHDLTNTVDATVEFSPVSWLDARYVLTKDDGRYDSVEGAVNPYADGRRFNTIASATSGYYKKVTEHQFDLIFKKDMFGMKNKVLVGGLFRENLQQYNANAGGAAFPFYGNIPGAANPLTNVSTTGALLVPVGFQTNVPASQVIRDRFGALKNVQQVYTEFDPGFEIQPDIKPLTVIDRTAIDGYYSQDQAGYINYQGQLMDDRLTVMGGVRREMHRDSGQYLTNNFPWFSPPPYAFADQTTYPPGPYGYDPGYAGDIDGNFSRIAGTSWMGGLSFEVKKNINVYASISKIYNRNGATNAGGYSKLNVPFIFQGAKNFLGNQPFVYNGKTITSVADLTQAFHDNGADVLIKPETGQNLEFGVKTSLWDNKLVATASVFHMFRVNRRVDDATRQATDPLNGANNYVFFGPAGTTNTPAGYNANLVGARLLRWRTVGQKDIIEGVDSDVIWTPTRNFQALVTGAWMWTAKTDNAPTVNKPGSAAYNASTPQAKVASDIYYGARLENVPEFRLNTVLKYTFTEGVMGLARGASASLNSRYSSKMVLSRSVDWNPLTNGFQSGDYLIFGAGVTLPWEVKGYRFTTSINAQNLLDKTYFEGGTIASPGRQLFITNTVKF